MKKLSYLLLLPAFLLLCGFFWSGPSWQDINNSIDSKYPSVENIDVESLKKMIEQGKVFTFIDVRKKTEFAISHLPEAVNITEASAITYPKDTPLVIYCSVGVRSAKFADTLSGLGYSKVVNLRGGIFTWANRGYLLIRSGKAVDVVHPYNRKWGTLLKLKIHPYEVDSP